MNTPVLDQLVLENDRVKLSPLLPEHYEALADIALKEKDLVQFSPTSIHTPELLKQYLERAQEERAIQFRYAFLVYDKKAGRAAGSTSYANISWYDKRLEIGWTWIGKAFQQSGLNRNMKFLMLQYAFEKLDFERVEFRTDERNNTSRLAMTKIGCKFEGILRNHMLMPDGHKRSSVYYSILRHEWPDIKARIFKTAP